MHSLPTTEDFEESNRLICRLLSTRGYATLSASNGETAVKLAEEKRPDLVLLDAFLRDMDGFEVLRALRTGVSTATIPVILVSGIADPDFKEHTIRRGTNGHWVMGAMDFDELADRIAALLAAPGQEVS